MPNDLAARCEAAGGADRELDAEIDNLLSGGSAVDLAYILADVEGTTRPPRYSASVDCALSLIPADWAWSVQYSQSCAASAWLYPPNNDNDEQITGHGATPALALCAAALRARAG